MKIRPTFLAVSVLCLGLTGCNDSLLAPAAPAFDGGYTFGGGHRNESTTSTSATASGETVAEEGTTSERGGFTIGGGH